MKSHESFLQPAGGLVEAGSAVPVAIALSDYIYPIVHTSKLYQNFIRVLDLRSARW